MPNARDRETHFYSYQDSENFVLTVLIAMVVTILATRFFLFVTGYPTLGNGTLHIAHVLWGGLAMFAAGTLLLIRRDAKWLAALLHGVGMGLFIDEVGKFLTADVNYFFPPAALIIYFIVICVWLIYRHVKNRSIFDPRVEVLQQLELVEESIMDGVSEDERRRFLQAVRRIRADASDADVRLLAEQLERFMHGPAVWIEPEDAPWFHKSFDFVTRQVRNSLLRISSWWRLTVVYFWFRLIAALVGVASYIAMLFVLRGGRVEGEELIYRAIRQYRLDGEWEFVLVTLDAVSQVFIAYFFLKAVQNSLFRRPERAIVNARSGFYVALLIGDLFAFYFLQFEAALLALADLTFLTAVTLREKQLAARQASAVAPSP